MGTFLQAHAFTAKWEGGLTDNPADPGGITNKGISLRFLKGLPVSTGDIDCDGDVDADDIRTITTSDAERLFRLSFWDTLKCDDYVQPVALALYDAAVNCGRAQAVKFVQRAINTLGGNLAVDGKLGTATHAALVVMGNGDNGSQLAQRICDQREAFYRGLAASRPSLAVFLKGWLNRVNDLRKHI